MAEEFDHLRTLDGAGKESKVKVPPRHPRHRRQSFPVEVVLQHRGLSPRCPGAAAMGPLAEPALVDENYDPAVLFGLFFNSGPLLLLPPRVAFLTRIHPPPRRSLATPAELPQDLPHMSRVIIHPAF